ncbi:MAG TPA: alpha-L-arabinofuranosidase C-terminal domain-containing protein [Blastocatellia bacterium]|nr:alpha-L-arabinofuranosidase C-terminal domain-containing protein [Blastocatellia bacterium]
MTEWVSIRLRVFVVGAVLLSLTVVSRAQQATIAIDAGKVEGRISPLLYGQFLEFMFEGIKGGLHAELIRNRSFEEAPNAIGLSRDWERYPDDRNDDYGLAFAWDAEVAYPNTKKAEGIINGHSLRLQLSPGVIERHGIYQSRIPIRQGIAYRGYFWAKAESFEGRVTIALEADQTDGTIYAETVISKISGDWKQYVFTLQPTKSDPLARFAILPDGRGRLWIDQVSLLPGDAVNGVRADVLAKVRALKPAFIRWPGGNVAQDYHWQWGIGLRAQRPIWSNLSWKNEPEPGDFGTDEFIQFCRTVGAEPSITVNVEGRGATVAEAAAWVEYCNGAVTSKYGAMRAANGHPEPYGVKYWEVGNEIWGDWVRGHSDAETYARNYNRYAAAMRAVDPTIKLIAVGDNDQKWNTTVLQRTQEPIDYLAIHHYYGTREMQGDARNLMARPLYYERFYQEVKQLLREQAPRRNIQLAINEWGLDLPVVRQHSMEAALYGARLMNVFERQGDVVGMSAVSDLVNGWPGGIIQASRHGVFTTPAYLVNQLYAQHLGRERLAIQVLSDTFDSSREGKGIAFLDAVASRSSDGRQIFLKAVNTDPARAHNVTINLSGARVAPTGEMNTVTAPSLTSSNNFARPSEVAIQTVPLNASTRFTVNLPKHSVSVLTLNVIQ